MPCMLICWDSLQNNGIHFLKALKIYNLSHMRNILTSVLKSVTGLNDVNDSWLISICSFFLMQLEIITPAGAPPGD